jgi:hypothetical protein
VIRYVAALAAVAALFSGVQTWRIGRLKHEVNEVRGELVAVRADNKVLERKLSDQRKEASSALADVQSRCTASIAVALKSGRVIERVTNAPSNPDGSRGRIDAASLRDVFGASEGQARPVPR